jgi:two-component system, chemotaxis family, chemotaxis protein CheY
MHSTQVPQTPLTKLLENITILLADNSQHLRKTMRMMLTNIGAKSINEVDNGLTVIEAIRTIDPDVMILDWNIPMLSAPEIMRIIRSPGVFPKPDLPVIMVTDNGTREVVREAVRLGVHEILVLPVSPKVLQQHLLSIFLAKRQMVQSGKHYIPQPRKQFDWALKSD